MPTTDAGLTGLTDKVHGMAEDFARSNKSAEGLSFSFGKLLVAVGGIELVKDHIKDIVTHSGVFVRLQQAVSKEALSQTGLLKSEIGLTSKINKLNRSKGPKNESQRARLVAVEAELGMLQKQKVVALELEKVGYARLGLLAAAAGVGVTLYGQTRELNQDLIKANSSWQHRERLMRETLITQAQTGIGFGEITRAAAALVNYSFDTETTFNENVRLVAQMEQGLGVAASESAQLASIVERQLKGSFKSVADVIAGIVDNTALAGNEVARLAQAIGTAMGRLKPGLGAQGLPEVVQLVARYEGALKQVGGMPGAFQELLTSLTTPSGIVGAGALGVQPEFISTAKGVREALDSFGRLGNMIVGQSQGMARQVQLQMFANLFHTNIDSANQMLIAIKQVNEVQTGQITVQDRWRNQVHATNSGILRLGNSLLALLQGGVYPLVMAVGWLANKLADAVEGVLESRKVVMGVSVALGIGFLALLGSLAGLVRGLWAVVFGSTAATAAIARYNAAQLASAGGGLGSTVAKALSGLSWKRLLAGHEFTKSVIGAEVGFGAKIVAGFQGFFPTLVMIGGWLGRIFGFLRGALSFLLLNPVGLLITGVTLVGWYASKWWSETKRLRQDAEMSRKVIIEKQDALELRHRSDIYAARRYGAGSEKIMELYTRLAHDAKDKFDLGLPGGRKAALDWLKDLPEEVGLELVKADVSAGLAKLTERTPRDQMREREELKSLLAKMLKVNQDQIPYLDRDEKRAIEQNQEVAADNLKANMLLWAARGFDPLGVPFFYKLMK